MRIILKDTVPKRTCFKNWLMGLPSVLTVPYLQLRNTREGRGVF